MKGVVAAIFFFLVSTLCVLQQQLLVVATATPIERVNQLAAAVKLEEACQYVPHKDLCISSLNTKKLIGLVVVAISVASDNASDISGVVHYMSEPYNRMDTQDLPEAKGVEKCSALYENVMQKLHNSSSAVIKRFKPNPDDYPSEVKKLVNEAIADSNSCDQLLISNLEKTRMGTRSQVFRQLCENIIAIVNILAGEI